jgi:threonine dehydrogenase-like Zn-dependent dehydrogenase
MQESLAANGRIVYLGRSANETPVQLNTMVTGAHAIVGSRGHAGFGIFPAIIRLLASGRLQVHGIITSRFGFFDTLAALEQSASRTDGKVMVCIS